MDTLLDVVKVKTHPDYALELEFENGEKRMFDMSPYMEKKPFNRLKDLTAFNAARIECGTVVWPGNIDIAPETLYDRSAPIVAKQSKSVAQQHAGNGKQKPGSENNCF